MDLDCVISHCISHNNDVMCFLLEILEIDYFTHATKFILIIHTGFGQSYVQSYVLVSSAVAERFSSTAAVRLLSKPAVHLV